MLCQLGVDMVPGRCVMPTGRCDMVPGRCVMPARS